MHLPDCLARPFVRDIANCNPILAGCALLACGTATPETVRSRNHIRQNALSQFEPIRRYPLVRRMHYSMICLRIATEADKSRGYRAHDGHFAKADLIMVSLRFPSDVFDSRGTHHRHRRYSRVRRRPAHAHRRDRADSQRHHRDAGRLCRSRSRQPWRARSRSIELKRRCRLVPLLGNHEQMLFSARASQMMCSHWLRFGGDATLRSFGPLGLKALTPEHLTFLESCRLHFETADASVRACQLRSRQADQSARRRYGPQPVTARIVARSSCVGQDRDRRPHGSRERRDSRSRLSQVPRHQLLPAVAI